MGEDVGDVDAWGDPVGLRVGLDDVGSAVTGDLVGKGVGLRLGLDEGDLTGLSVGASVVGRRLGRRVGFRVGRRVGRRVGFLVGRFVGLFVVGLLVGRFVVGLYVGEYDGLSIGLLEGAAVAPGSGDGVGILVGYLVGNLVGKGVKISPSSANTITNSGSKTPLLLLCLLLAKSTLPNVSKSVWRWKLIIWNPSESLTGGFPTDLRKARVTSTSCNVAVPSDSNLLGYPTAANDPTLYDCASCTGLFHVMVLPFHPPANGSMSTSIVSNPPASPLTEYIRSTAWATRSPPVMDEMSNFK